MAADSNNPLRKALQANHQLTSRTATADFAAREFEHLQQWQRQRLTQTYADFLAQESSAPACQFFLRELYGGENFRKRDQDIARVEPVMSRLLPRNALLAVAKAMRLQAISLELDMAMATMMRSQGIRELDDECYAQIYRASSTLAQRKAQIRLIRQLGHELEKLVKTPVLLRLLKLLRAPAIAAGFGELQRFLENGLHAFRQLQEPGLFVETIYRREWQIMEQMFQSQPVSGDGSVNQ